MCFDIIGLFTDDALHVDFSFFVIEMPKPSSRTSTWVAFNIYASIDLPTNLDSNRPDVIF
jgi:hypothetical protein